MKKTVLTIVLILLLCTLVGFLWWHQTKKATPSETSEGVAEELVIQEETFEEDANEFDDYLDAAFDELDAFEGP